MPIPRWLPPPIDRSKVEARGITGDPSDPRYEVVYTAANGAQIMLALGPVSTDMTGMSGVGTRVRGVPAVLSFSADLWRDPTASGIRRVRWQEGRYVLRIESDRFSGDDLLHIAWYLDPTGQPAPANPYTRTRVGACAPAGAPPETTVRNLLGLTGRGDRDAILDCWAMDQIVEQPAPGVGGWSALPTTSGVKIHSVQEIAGRVEVAASWTFAIDPGGAWGRTPTRFFVLGPEDGRWRIFGGGTAPFGHSP